MNVLFVDECNDTASQLAQAWAEHAGLSARSAGLRAATRIDPSVVSVLNAQRLGAAEREPRTLTSEDLAWATVVVAIDCDFSFGASLPALMMEWRRPDATRVLAGELSVRMRRLVVELVMDVAGLPIRGAAWVPSVVGSGRRVR